MTHWHAIQVSSATEFETAAILDLAGFDVFVPVVWHRRKANRYSKRKVLVSRPMLVSYIFAASRPFKSIQTALDLFYWKRLGNILQTASGQSSPIQDSAIDILREESEKSFEEANRKPPPKAKPFKSFREAFNAGG